MKSSNKIQKIFQENHYKILKSLNAIPNENFIKNINETLKKTYVSKSLKNGKKYRVECSDCAY